MVQGLGIRLPLQGDVGAIPSLETGNPRDMGNQAHWPQLESPWATMKTQCRQK